MPLCPHLQRQDAALRPLARPLLPSAFEGCWTSQPQGASHRINRLVASAANRTIPLFAYPSATYLVATSPSPTQAGLDKFSRRTPCILSGDMVAYSESTPIPELGYISNPCRFAKSEWHSRADTPVTGSRFFKVRECAFPRNDSLACDVVSKTRTDQRAWFLQSRKTIIGIL